jgi:hypothetical protein
MTHQVTELNKKVLALILVTVSMLLVTPLTHADGPPTVSVWTDKTEYAPGETGTLYMRFYNSGGSAVTIANITIEYTSWVAYRNSQWEGNQTITVNQAVISKGIYSNETKFTVPTDGRAVTTYVDVVFHMDPSGTFGPWPTPQVHVAETPKYMDQLIMIMTVQAVLLIVCTAIIAAALFLSGRRSQITWKSEEKQ